MCSSDPPPRLLIWCQFCLCHGWNQQPGVDDVHLPVIWSSVSYLIICLLSCWNREQLQHGCDEAIRNDSVWLIGLSLSFFYKLSDMSWIFELIQSCNEIFRGFIASNYHPEHLCLQTESVWQAEGEWGENKWSIMITDESPIKVLLPEKLTVFICGDIFASCVFCSVGVWSGPGHIALCQLFVLLLWVCFGSFMSVGSFKLLWCIEMKMSLWVIFGFPWKHDDICSCGARTAWNVSLFLSLRN